VKRRYFIFDSTRCFGCHGCVAACANANQTPAGLLWRSLLKLPPHDRGSDSVYLSIACNHCRKAPCVIACPARALVRREHDGIVIHHADCCIGCRYCQMACPYDAIKWDEVRGAVSKCHFCHERLAAGMEPACVETCFAGALMQLVVDEPEQLARYEKQTPGLVHLPEVDPSIRCVTREMAGRPPRTRPFPPALPSREEGEDR
jgi:Fe-S-cluster-containing dehydrogenase component